jgi:hypothetical protein
LFLRSLRSLRAGPSAGLLTGVEERSLLSSFLRSLRSLRVGRTAGLRTGSEERSLS